MTLIQDTAPSAGLLADRPPATRGKVLRRIDESGETIAGVQYKNCNVMDFDQRQYIFSHRAIMTLVVVSTCNAACHFCSNEITFTPAGPFLEWNDNLARAKEFALTAGVTKIAYTGGEPTLNPERLLSLMTAMNPGFSRARLHTNGFGLFKPVATDEGARPLIDAMIAVGLTGASLSVAHFDGETNRSIMKLPRSWAGMSDEALAAVAARASASFTPRLSCVMTSEGVSTIDHIFEYMRWGRALGFRKFIFRTCSEIPDGFKKDTTFTAYNDANKMSVDSLADQFDLLPDLRRKYRQRKSDSKVDVYEWDDITFDVDESSEEPDPDPKIRRLNVMTNGVTYTSWIDPLSVLFEDELARAELSMTREFGSTSLKLVNG